jgi:hypothetical protein
VSGLVIVMVEKKRLETYNPIDPKPEALIIPDRQQKLDSSDNWTCAGACVLE